MNDHIDGHPKRGDANLGLGLTIGVAGCVAMGCSLILGVVLGGWAGFHLYDGSGKPPEESGFQQMGFLINGGIAGGILLPSVVFLVAWYMAYKQLAKPHQDGQDA